MEVRNTSNHHLSHDGALLQEKCQKIAGRTGVIAAVMLFIVAYVYGILEFGALPTILLGWLPCGGAAWLTAILVVSLGAPAIRHVILIWRQLSLLVRLLASI